MLASIDRAGRVVIPKELREALDLDADTQLTIDVDGGTLRLTPVRAPGRRVVEVDGWPVLEPAADRRTTDADVQRWRDADQR